MAWRGVAPNPSISRPRAGRPGRGHRGAISALALGLALLISAAGGQAAPLDGPFHPDPLKAEGPPPPWSPRRRAEAPGMEGKGWGLIDLSQWPAEPAAPGTVEPERFAEAMRELCPKRLPAGLVRSVARAVLAGARQFEVDPFLIAGLAYDQSRCRPRKRSGGGVGLTMISLRMHRPWIRHGMYRYWVRQGGQWRPRRLAVDRYPFTPASLQRPEVNAYFAAAFLHIFSQQCPRMHGHFHSVPHRHPVSHFVWGDHVRGAGVEDRILRARRRTIEYYRGWTDRPRGMFRGLRLSSPLDGAPHKITSALGDDRDGGARRHTGVDFESYYGEPVRAVAPGTVLLAGVDWGFDRLGNLDPRAARQVPEEQMGPRGRLVMIEHPKGLITTYMHLQAYTLRAGQRVERGDLVGWVGRSGIRQSVPHLHFDMRHDGSFLDPMVYLEPYVIPPEATFAGRRKAATQARRRYIKMRVRTRRAMRALLMGRWPGQRRLRSRQRRLRQGRRRSRPLPRAY